MPPPMVEFRGVRKVFYKRGQAIEALGGVSLSVRRGEFLAILGPSGCGKSTLLNMAAGLMRPTAGEVRFDDGPVTGVNTRVGYLTQKDSLLPWRTAEGNVGIALEIQGQPAAERRAAVRECLALVGLTGFERHYPAELSGGMRKRVSLARMLVQAPETFLMDEPFGALDAQLKMVLQAELLRIWQATDKTVVFVTHELQEALTLADRVVVLTARPGRLKGEVVVPLPRPRDVYSLRSRPEFNALYDELWSTIGDDLVKGEAM